MLARLAPAQDQQPARESSPIDHLDNTDDAFWGMPEDQDVFHDTPEALWHEDAEAAYVPVPEAVTGSPGTASTGEQDVPTWTNTYLEQGDGSDSEGSSSLDGSTSEQLKVRCAPLVHAQPEHLAARDVATSLAVL